jgi:hypothetical protein
LAWTAHFSPARLPAGTDATTARPTHTLALPHTMLSKAATAVVLVLAGALLGGAGAQSTQGGDSGSGWGTSDAPWSLRSLYSRVTGLPAVASLCTISNCQREKPLPVRPGGREVARN